MNPSIAYSFLDETPEAKARWFQSLSLDERMEIFCAFTDLILETNPKIIEQKYAPPDGGRIRVLTKPQS